MDSVLRVALQERPEFVGPCIPPAVNPPADRPRADGPALDSVREVRVDVLASASVPADREQAPDSFHLLARHRVRNEPDRTPAVAANNIRRPKKAR